MSAVTVDVELQTLADLRRHEGLRLKPYKDSLGNWTQGYGRARGIKEDSPEVPREQAEKWLLADYIEAKQCARKLVSNFDSLDNVRKTVLINMAFNLGCKKLGTFKNTIRFIETGNYHQAALNMLDSLWASQVKGRATELAKRMSTGKINPQYLVVV